MPDQISGLLSPFLRSRRIAISKSHLKGRVLDYGCGIGALCEHVGSAEYVGVDIDAESIETARRLFPNHSFFKEGEYTGSKPFDTIVCLAVIEHVKEPERILSQFRSMLAADGKIVMTTPHPNFDWIHRVGAMVKVFSQTGRDDHETLLDKKDLYGMASRAGLQVYLYKRFLLGANQFIVLKTPV